MSQENVEIVRKLVEAWNEHHESLAASDLAGDIEWAPAGPAAVDRVIYRGREECARWFCPVWQTWDEFRFQETEVRDLDDRFSGSGRVQCADVPARWSSTGVRRPLPPTRRPDH